MNPPTPTSNRRRLYLVVFLVLGVIIAISAFLVIKGRFSPQSLLKKQASVDLKTTYNNPFDKDSQYVNPFQKYKNPFVVNR